MLTGDQFERARKLALELAGIQLLDRHRELLGRRTRRLGIRDCAALDSLLSAAEQGERAAIEHLLYLLTTKFTGFFRHPRHFDLAAAPALEVTQQRGRARLWSAGAATGEEPYSLAMALIDVFRREDPPVRVLATDLDVETLKVAQRGEYAEAALRALEPGRRARFFTKSAALGRWSIAPAVRRLVEFRALNLAEVAWSIAGPFDVIFCRNVLMYLEARHRCAALERMASLLAPEGLLMLDPTEHLGPAGHLFTPGKEGVYSCPRPSNPRRGEDAAPYPTTGRADCPRSAAVAGVAAPFHSIAGDRG